MTLIVTDEVELKELVGELQDRRAFAFDTETIGTDEGFDVRLDVRLNQVVWLSFATQGLSFVVPVGHPHGEQRGWKKEPRVGSDGKTRNFKVPDWAPAPPQLRPSVAFGILEPLFFDEDVEKTGHNLKFDLETCAKYYGGDVIPGPYFDSQVAAHTLNENLHQYKLGVIVQREFGYVYDKKVGEQIERYGFKAAARYAHHDAKFTWLLRQKYGPQIERQHLDGLWRLEMDVLESLLYMRDPLLDVAAAEQLYEELSRERNKLIGTLFRLAGREVNLNSHPQMTALLFGPKKDGGFGLRAKVKTPKGAPSTGKEALALYADHPFVETYLKLQEVEKVRSTYLQAYLGGEVEKQVNGKKTIEQKRSILVDGRVHANYKQHGTTTGRFSCSEPNLQNIPRPDTELGAKIRGMFIEQPGWSMVVADYAQIEYVVMAHFSRDPVLVKAFETGVDLHKLVAGMVFGIDVEAVEKKQRTVAKNTNFAVAYGAGTDKVAAMSKISVPEAEDFRKKHRRMLPKLYRWTDSVVAECKRSKPPHVKTLLGRRRRLPTIHSAVWGVKSEAERQAVNSVVQGSAADIIKLAMVRLHRLCDDEMRLTLSVHDELVLSVPDDRIEDGQRIMREAMLGEGIQRLLTVPMNIDMQVVKRWSEAKE